MPLDSPPLPNDDQFDDENARRNMDDIGLSNVTEEGFEEIDGEIQESLKKGHEIIAFVKGEIEKAQSVFSELQREDRVTHDDLEYYIAAIAAFSDQITEIQKQHQANAEALDELVQINLEFRQSIQKRLDERGN